MTRHYFTPAPFLACLLFLLVGLAKAGITQCVDEAGAVTYTNVPCENNTGDTQASALRNPPTIAPKVAPVSEISIDGDDTRRSTWATMRANTRSVTLDVETMKAARSSLLAMDQASHLLRRQEVLALDQRNRNWFDFQ